jgi:DNA repair protein RecO (recombination protein O)
MLTKDLAVCIRAVDYSETSQIVTFFARDNGKISAIAKGSKRPKSSFDGPIELLANGEIVFADSNKEKLATLTEFQQAPAFSNLHKNLHALYCCLFAAELLNSLTHDYDPHLGLFENFLQFLKDTNEMQDSPDDSGDVFALLILFQLSLLNEIGLKPILNSCANCKTRYEIRDTRYETYFSSSSNGLICRDCEASFPDRIRLSKKAAACLINLKMLPEADKDALKEIEKVLINHFTNILGHQPKMAKHILKTH